MSKSRQNKNDRKRQRRKDFSHGRDWQTASQDHCSPYPKSGVAQRADAQRRAQIAGIRTNLPAATWRTINATDPGVDIDLSSGAINIMLPVPRKALSLAAYAKMIDQKLLAQALYGIGPAFFGGISAIEDARPDLHREMKIGEILAYRCWRLVGNQLRSVYMRDDWNPGEIMVGHGIEDWSERGIHAWKDLNSKKFNDYVRGYLSVADDPRMLRHEREQSTVIVTGTVHLWGDVVEHEHGYRAEYARIVSLDWLYPDAELMGRERETLARLRSLYGVS